MNDITIAFYKSDTGKILDTVIDSWSSLMIKLLHNPKSKCNGFSHVELIFSNGESFSSSPRDGGTRFKEINYVPDRWEFLTIKSIYAEEEIYEKATSLAGLNYDYIGIFLHEFIPLNIDDQHSWWCSELICYLLGLEDYKISPNYLYLLANENKLVYRDKNKCL